MATTLEAFAAACKGLLQAAPGPAGRQAVVERLAEALKDEAFLASVLRDDTPDREILYEDPDQGFCIVAHNYQGPKDSTPHDHGPSWAIYGQATGETTMHDWRKLTDPEGDAPGKAELVRTYKLTPGMAHLYNEGDMHSPSRADSTRLIRIEGTNMDKVSRAKYEPA